MCFLYFCRVVKQSCPCRHPSIIPNLLKFSLIFWFCEFANKWKTVLPLLESDSDDMCHLSQSLEFEFLVNFNILRLLTVRLFIEYSSLIWNNHAHYTPSIKLITLMIHTNSKTSTIFLNPGNNNANHNECQVGIRCNLGSLCEPIFPCWSRRSTSERLGSSPYGNSNQTHHIH